METIADVLRKEGEQQGISLGELKNSKEMLLEEAISEKFEAVSPDLVRRVNSIDSHENLKMLLQADIPSGVTG